MVDEREGLDVDLNEARIKSLSEFTRGLSQECGWLKSVMGKLFPYLELGREEKLIGGEARVDRLKNGTISKLALQVSEYYQSALQYAEQSSTPFPEVTSPISFPEVSSFSCD